MGVEVEVAQTNGCEEEKREYEAVYPPVWVRFEEGEKDIKKIMEIVHFDGV